MLEATKMASMVIFAFSMLANNANAVDIGIGAQAKIIGEHLRTLPHEFPTKVSQSNEVDLGNAQARWDIKNGVCLINVGTGKGKNNATEHLKNPKWSRYLALHEYAHCQLFNNPSGIGEGQKVLNRVQKQVIDDFFALHMVSLDVDYVEDVRKNAWVIFHEMYADSRAILKLTSEGNTQEDLLFVVQMRHGGAFDESHATSPALERALAIGKDRLLKMSDSEVDALAKTIALENTLRNISYGLNSEDGSRYLVGPRLESLLKGFYQQSQRGPLKLEKYVLNQDKATPEDLGRYSAVKFILSAAGRETIRGMDEKDWVKHWYKTRYGLNNSDFSSITERLSAHLERQTNLHDAPTGAAALLSTPVRKGNAARP